jgi:tetratricopeptide (TPR) repeat protein
MMMAFVSSGMLVGVLVYKNVIPVREISFLNNPRKSFFAILCLMILMIMTLSLTYVYFEKFVSIFYYSKSLNKEMNIESLSKSEVMILSAIKLNKNDIYYRNLSQLYLDQIRFVLADENISEDDLKSNLQQLVSLAEENAINAVNQNKKLYLNHLNLGNVYSSLSSLGIEGSYEKSIESFNKAKELAPNNPSIVLARASLEFLNENNEEAKQFISEALLLKTNYTDAFFLLAEIEAKEGNVSGAIKQAENAAQKSPNDSSIFFRLGMLRYSNNDYSGSISAFERAVILDSNNLNARYFLGQSYQKVNRKEEALVQYNILSNVLPDSQEVKDAINSISSRNSSVEIIKENIENEGTNLGDIKDNTNKNQ